MKKTFIIQIEAYAEEELDFDLAELKEFMEDLPFDTTILEL